MAEMDAEIKALLERHYRDEWGNCGYCQTTDGYDSWTADWPCDAAILLKRMGYTIREDPPHVCEARKPDPLQDAIADIWSDEMLRIVTSRNPFVERLIGESLG